MANITGNNNYDVLRLLRLKAEEQLDLDSLSGKRLNTNFPYISPVELLNEVEIYQIELEMQNSYLQATLKEVQASYEQYFKLYQSAPIGFISLNINGVIRKFNQKTQDLIGLKRFDLNKMRLIQYVDDAYKQQFSDTMNSMKGDKSTTKKSLEVALIREDQTLFLAQIDFIYEKNNEDSFELSITDSSNIKPLFL